MQEAIDGVSNETRSTSTTHVLNIEGHSFPIYHIDRRLYKFQDWKDAREKLIKIILKKVKEHTGLDTAFIEFKMANPMRKSRLGNFFIDIQAEILHSNKPVGTIEELGVRQIFCDNFITLDQSEMDMRDSVEIKYSSEQYSNELDLRLNSLKSMGKIEEFPNYKKGDTYESLAKKLMADEGWHVLLDNRLHARKARMDKLLTK